MDDKNSDRCTSGAVDGKASQCPNLHPSIPSRRIDRNSVTCGQDGYQQTTQQEARTSDALKLRVLNVQLHREPMLQDERLGQQCESALTPREAEVLEWASCGKSNPEIATILGISQWTVKIHMSRVLRKLNASTRGHAIAKVAAKSVMDTCLAQLPGTQTIGVQPLSSS